MTMLGLCIDDEGEGLDLVDEHVEKKLEESDGAWKSCCVSQFSHSSYHHLVCALATGAHSVILVYDSEALCDTCRRSRNFGRPSYTNLNGGTLRSFPLTASLRFGHPER